MDRFSEKGWVKFEGVVKGTEEICSSVVDDVMRVVFEPEGEMDNVKNCPQNKQLELLTDVSLRRKYLRNEKCVWENGNSRKPKVSKNSGLCNLYHNPKVREKVLFNREIYRRVQFCYSSILGREVDLVYKNGPDRVSIKPPGATEMPKHIDIYLTRPVEQHRVQTVVTLQAAGQICDGSTELLEGYSSHFDAGCYWFGKHSEFFCSSLPQQLGKSFDSLLPEFNEWLNEFYADGHLSRSYDCPVPLPQKRTSIRWIQPLVTAGDILCFDQRTPHRNTKNRSSVTRIAAFVSLYPTEQWNRTYSIADIFTGASSDRNGGTNRSGDAEKLVFADQWAERIEIDTSVPHILQVLGLN